jgi:hypothetical protein
MSPLTPLLPLELRKSIQTTAARFTRGDARISGYWLSAAAPAAGFPLLMSMRKVAPASGWKFPPRSMETLASTAEEGKRRSCQVTKTLSFWPKATRGVREAVAPRPSPVSARALLACQVLPASVEKLTRMSVAPLRVSSQAATTRPPLAARLGALASAKVLSRLTTPAVAPLVLLQATPALLV